MLSVQEFSQKQIVQEWLSSCQEGNLLKALKEHWKVNVPFAFDNKHDSAKQERLIEKLLLRPMEHFLCNGEPDNVFEQIKALDKPSQICGHVFKSGEPTYTCRECAYDGTCVLCIDCFQKSIHRTHKYRMHSSGGGGYCDCGDPEAWKMEPFCDLHKKGTEHNEQQNPIELLPDDLIDRSSALFIATLSYAVEMLTWDHADSLPESLQPNDALSNEYVCMLFNDEVHTFDQVIECLQKAVACTHKDAAMYATVVDREGRSVVKTSSFDACEKAKNIIERSTSRQGSNAIKSKVMHTTVVAHQDFALKIIQWLQNMTNKSDGLRRLFCILSMQPHDGEQSLMEKLLLSDTLLWKGARVHCHKVLMSGVLMDPGCKKQFAELFTILYPRLIQAFCMDDHDHDVSITSLSVQIFTVPSLARHLIAEHNLLHVVVEAFLQNYRDKINDKGRLEFTRNESTQSFKRAGYMIYDIKYILTCRPSDDEWNDKLRKNFIDGAVLIIDQLMAAMQNMDAVVRQTGNHLEFEPEWENAFNLQIKLGSIIELLLLWCASDKYSLAACYTATMRAVVKLRLFDKPMEQKSVEVGGYTCDVMKYDVGQQPVSVHAPVTRFLAALHALLGKFGLSAQSEELQVLNGPDMKELIEPSLRCLVLVAQTQCGLWRRNGFSLLNQIYFYHNVRCRDQMYDMDIMMLQAGAACIDNNEFLIHLMNKFGLLHWFLPSYDNPDRPQGGEDSVNQTKTLAEEFISLLIVIISERYKPGISGATPDDIIRREIIHQLCLSPMTHSELNKQLPENHDHQTGVEDNVDAVANFKKPSGTTKGKYKLKPEFYKEYNPFFYHYNKSDQSKAEGAQLSRKKHEEDNQALPPPVPPKLTDQFKAIAGLLECDMMIQIMRLILLRTASEYSRSWSETQFEKVLHLIGLALHEQKRAFETNSEFHFLSRASEEGSSDIGSMLQDVVNSTKLTHDTLKDLLTWTIQKYAEVKKLQNQHNAMDTVDTVSVASTKKSEKEKKKKAELAAKKRAKMMGKISAMQQKFLREHPSLCKTESDLNRSASDMDLCDLGGTSMTPVALGRHKTPPSASSVSQLTCILCQEDQEISCNGRTLVLAAYVQQSTVLSQRRGEVIKNGEDYDPLFTSSSLPVGPYTSSCGHAMHSDCWQRFFDNLLAKERRRPPRFRQKFSFNMDKNEFLCPLCECLSNTVMPVIPPLQSLSSDQSTSDSSYIEFDDWLDGIKKTCLNSIEKEKEKKAEDSSDTPVDESEADSSKPSSSSTEDVLKFLPCQIQAATRLMTQNTAQSFNSLWAYLRDDASENFSGGMRDMILKFARDVYQFGLNVHPDDDDERVPLMAWNTCAFTIQVIEQCQRVDEKPLFGSLPARLEDCLSTVVKFAAVCGQMMNIETVKKHCIRNLTALFLCDEEVERASCILDIDMFHYLIILSVTLPMLYCDIDTSVFSSLLTGGVNESNCLRICLIGHLTQILLLHETTDAPETECDTMETDSATEGEQLLKIMVEMKKMAGMNTEKTPSAWQLATDVRNSCLPFLRCAAVFFHYVTGVSPPQSLRDDVLGNYGDILQYLNLPLNLSTLFTDEEKNLDGLVKSWCSNKLVKERFNASSVSTVQYPLKSNKLIDLPDDYSQLINHVSKFTCPRSQDDDSRAPTMCLVCSKILCSQSYCCQTELNNETVGAATEHSYACGSGVGMFLRVRDCQVLLLSGKSKGCFLPAPYIDDYGETDQGLRRGNPLHLCKDAYWKLFKLWVSHAIPETIAHKLESNSSMLFEWQHL